MRPTPTTLHDLTSVSSIRAYLREAQTYARLNSVKACTLTLYTSTSVSSMSSTQMRPSPATRNPTRSYLSVVHQVNAQGGAQPCLVLCRQGTFRHLFLRVCRVCQRVGRFGLAGLASAGLAGLALAGLAGLALAGLAGLALAGLAGFVLAGLAGFVLAGLDW